MGFGGGGGSTGVTNHLHTNAVGEGGSLNETSLIKDIPLFALTVAL
jgi:hypothetical protein|tara:strand:+ start:154 stop:291 length:138 start_codon:yes stop_codon:yes gene_type:complete